jgi:protein-tyrosine phosphatase
MKTELFWVPTPFPGRLAVAPRPRGGDWLDDEMKAWRAAGVDVIVSLLTPDEVAEFELGREAEAAAAQGMHYLTLPVADRDVPASRPAFRELVGEVTRELAAGRRVVAHCRQGIGRAGLVAAGVLIAAGIDPEAAVARLTAARGRPVPETPEQRRWLDAFANETETLTAAGTNGDAPKDHKG